MSHVLPGIDPHRRFKALALHPMSGAILRAHCDLYNRTSGAIVALLLMGLSAWSIADAVPPNTDWSLLGNSEEMQHHSDLDQIDRSNVGRLGLAWWVDMPGKDGLVGNPLIKNGVIFQSGSLDRVYANDLRTGKLLWSFEPRLTRTSIVAYMDSRWNRGVALAGELVIVATADCRLIALDQKTGKVRWQAPSCDESQQYGITGAPRVGGGMVFIGNNCADRGVSRGFVDAFDAASGQRRWRFYTVPDDPSKPQSALYRKAAKSWGEGWYAKTRGCGSAWDAMTYDPQLQQLYIGTGGPSPWNPKQRGKGAGDELFTNAIVAIDARTGSYVWHFSEVPHDGWNLEASVGIMVATLPIDGQDRRVVISVPKDGFCYVLDARTGKFLSGNNYLPVNWAKGLDDNGRPIYSPEAAYWEKPDGSAIALPSAAGAHGASALAYNPADHLIYIPARYAPARFSPDPKDPVGGVNEELLFKRGGDRRWEPYGETIAWDPLTQRARWRQRESMPFNGGLLHTAGNLLFGGGADGYFSAYDAQTGRKLWTYPSGGAIQAAPSTVILDGQQYIIIPNGNGASSAGVLAAPRARSGPRLLAFKLDGHVAAPPWATVPRVPKPAVKRLERSLADRGEGLFNHNFCTMCHRESVGGEVPDLRIVQPTLELMNAVVIGGTLKANGMPQFASMKPEDLKAIYAYLINHAWDAYERQQ